MSGEPIKVGVLIVGSEVIQLLDLAAIDVLGSCDPAYLRVCLFPDELVAKSRPIEVSYIGEKGAGSHAILSSDARILITVSDPEVLGILNRRMFTDLPSALTS